jgi:hypothetical protein
VRETFFPGEARTNIKKVKGDNHASVEGGFNLAKEAGICSSATFLNCLFHGMNRVGVNMYEHTAFAFADGWVQRVKTLLKSGDKIKRRIALRQYLIAKNVASERHHLCFDFSDTRLSAYAEAVEWNLWVLPVLVDFCNENNLTSCSEYAAANKNKIHVQLAILGDPLTQVYSRCQSLEQRFLPRLRFADEKAPCMVAHLQYELFESMVSYLESITSTAKRQVTSATVGRMFHSLWLSGDVPRGQVNNSLKQYNAAFEKGVLIAKKYMASKSGVYANHARVLDPRRRVGMSEVIGDYQSTFGDRVHTLAVQIEWARYWQLPSARSDAEVRDPSVDAWWEMQADTFPHLHALAEDVLLENLCSVDVEASFSTLKQGFK